MTAGTLAIGADPLALAAICAVGLVGVMLIIFIGWCVIQLRARPAGDHITTADEPRENWAKAIRQDLEAELKLMAADGAPWEDTPDPAPPLPPLPAPTAGTHPYPELAPHALAEAIAALSRAATRPADPLHPNPALLARYEQLFPRPSYDDLLRRFDELIGPDPVWPEWEPWPTDEQLLAAA